LKEILGADYADDRQRLREYISAAQSLHRKRRIKRQVRRQRRHTAFQVQANISAIPVRVHPADATLHFPASADDVREVLRRLQPGTVNGLHSITLCLGKDRQLPNDDSFPDPITGRQGRQYLPGVYAGTVYGSYFYEVQRIELYGFVYEPHLPDRVTWEGLMRLQMLLTLLHEIAHHVDYTTRMGRGRWYGQNRSRVEAYAESMEQTWANDVVFPYLQLAHPESCSALERWMTQHTGTDISWPDLFHIPRDRVKHFQACWPDEMIDIICAMALEQGKPGEIESQIAFAELLTVLNQEDEALRVLNHVLARSPEDPRAMEEKAALLLEQGNVAEARQWADRAILAHPNMPQAWWVLACESFAAGDWSRLTERATAGLAARCEDLEGIFRYFAVLANVMQDQDRDMGKQGNLWDGLPVSDVVPDCVELRALNILFRGNLYEAVALARATLDHSSASQRSAISRAILLAISAAYSAAYDDEACGLDKHRERRELNATIAAVPTFYRRGLEHVLSRIQAALGR
jgi:hypothetical protein